MTRWFVALFFVGVFVLLFGTMQSFAHPGGRDSYGCHNDRKAGTYHCHAGPCVGKTFSSQAAMLADACYKKKD